MATPPIAALEIGTSRTVMCVGDSADNGRMKITGIGIYPTTGVRKGQIIDLNSAGAGIQKASAQAEKQAHAEIWQAMLGISGCHIKADTNTGVLQIRSGGNVVSGEDIYEVSEYAKDMQLDSDRQILHTIEQSYKLDDQSGIIKPEGMRCKTLSKNMLIVHGQKSKIDNAISAVKSTPIDVADVAYTGICAALAVLTEEQKRNGVVLIDLGGGTTDYVVYSNEIITAAGCIAVGGDHVTNDIALAFNIPQVRAEAVKLSEGCAIVDAEYSVGRVSLTADVGFEERAMSRKALHTVINARMDETFRVLRTKLDDAGLLPQMGGGIVLTGGGAYLRKVTELAQRVFGLPCRIGSPVDDVIGWESMEQPAALASAIGLVLYGQKTYESRNEPNPVVKFITKVFKR